MKNKGSIVAQEIINDWSRQKELKKLYEAKQRKEIKKEEQNSIK